MSKSRKPSSKKAGTRKPDPPTPGGRPSGPSGWVRRRVASLFERIRRFLFGDDVFISYSRGDASGYALALAASLTEAKVSCYLDQWGTRPGAKLPDGLVTSLKRSSLLVLLGTPGAAQSDLVRQEVSLFLQTGKPIVPVSFDGVLEQAAYYGMIKGLAVFAEKETARQTASPDPALIRRILNAERFTSRARRLRQVFRATAVSIGLLILVGASITGYFAVRANEQRRAAGALRLTSDSVAALKQEDNPTKADSLARRALAMDPRSVLAWGALLDARYSQVFRWNDRYYSVPQSRSFSLSGILWAADLSHDARIVAAGSWDPPIAKMWRLDGGEPISLLGFESLIWRIRFSPDDAHLLVAAKTGPSRIYDRNGTLRCRLPVGDRVLTTVEFSGDGQHVIAGFEDGTASIWKTTDGTEVVRLELENRVGMTSASFSPDGSSLLTSHADGTAIVWDRHGKELLRLPAGSEPLNVAVFSPDGRQIVTASENGEAKIWYTTGRLLGSIEHNRVRWSRGGGLRLATSGVMGASWSPDGSRLVTYTNDGQLKLLHRGGAVLWSADAHEGSVRGARFANEGRHLVSFGDDNTIRLWTADGERLLTLGEFTGPVLAGGVSPDGDLVYGSSWDGSVKVFSLRELPLTVYSGQEGNSKAKITPDGKHVVSVSLAGRAVLWERNGTHVETIEPDAGWLHDVALSPSGGHALIYANRGGLLWSLESRRWRRLPLEARITSAKFFPDGRRFVTGSTDSTLRIWELHEESTPILIRTSSAIGDLDLSPDATRVAVALESGHTEVWSVQDRTRLWDRSYHNQESVNSIRYSRDGSLVLSGGSDDYRAILCDANGNILSVFRHASDVLGAVFSEDGEIILTNSTDGSARLWRPDGTLQAEFRTPGPVNRALLSKRQRFVATASNDGRVRLWDVAGTLLATLPAGDSSVNWIDMSSDEGWLVSSSTDGQILGWNLRVQSATR
ncbi:TIR domain-containing protein [Candidatus Eisenbacteria bacterium]|uniref:TIR domain-containing protein n=1 Tax=Eiseniibacteriota bacterium TaxID=2212470 RepID=A0ABV6YKB1_UNCEI